ncbi:DUF2163 domain-containing protein [Rhodopila sp.]|uniref:DUF2163 domain-containing protein n=1 Tax=Rhodopila sp. TaxID=2480087 RepID=UPI003D142464
MKAVSSDLLALWASRNFFGATLYTITLSSGTVLRYTSYGMDIVHDGFTFSAGLGGGAAFETSPAKSTWKNGLDVSTLSFDVMPKQATINGVPFIVAAVNGVFDNATVMRERAYMPTGSAAAVGSIILDGGQVSEIDLGREKVTFNVADFRQLLDIQMPRRLYQASCSNALFDASCALNRATFTAVGTATSGSTASVVSASLAASSGYYDLGVITFTSGANAGLSRTVKTYTTGTIQVIVPFPSAPATGDGFSIYVGCDKSLSTCGSKFSNQANFHGQPFIPIAETAS